MEKKCSCCGSSDVFKYSDDSAFERYVCKNCGHVDFYMTDNYEFIRRRQTLIDRANYCKDFCTKFVLEYKPYITKFFNMVLAVNEKETEIIKNRKPALEEELNNKKKLLESLDITIRQHDELLSEVPEIEQRLKKLEYCIEDHEATVKQIQEDARKCDDLLWHIGESVVNNANVVDDPYASFFGIAFVDPDEEINYESLNNKLKEILLSDRALIPFMGLSIDEVPNKFDKVFNNMIDFIEKDEEFSDDERQILKQIVYDNK